MTGHPTISPEVAARLPAIRQAIADGMTWTGMAEALGLSRGTVTGTIRRWLRAEWDARPNPRPSGGDQRKRKPEPPPEVVAAVVPEAVPEAPVAPSWLALPVPPARSCQWPSTPWRRPWPLCGAAVTDVGCPYCPVHRSLAYAGTARRLMAEAA